MENDYAAYLKKHQGKIVILSRVQEKLRQVWLILQAPHNWHSRKL